MNSNEYNYALGELNSCEIVGESYIIVTAGNLTNS